MNGICAIIIVFVFHAFSMLELNHKVNGPEHRILREVSSLEPAPKIWKLKSRSKNAGFRLSKFQTLSFLLLSALLFVYDGSRLETLNYA